MTISIEVQRIWGRGTYSASLSHCDSVGGVHSTYLKVEIRNHNRADDKCSEVAMEDTLNKINSLVKTGKVRISEHAYDELVGNCLSS